MSDVSVWQAAKAAGLPYTDEELRFAQSVIRGESGYGNWEPSAKTVELSKQFGLTGREGVGSFNMGAIQGTGPAGSFFHVDTHKDGTPYKGAFRKYQNAGQGFADAAKIILKPNVRAAIALGDGKAAVYNMHANGYFELEPSEYVKAVKRNYTALVGPTGGGGLTFDGVPLVDPPPETLPTGHPALGSSLGASQSVSASSPAHFNDLSGSLAAELPTLRPGAEGLAVRLFFGETRYYSSSLEGDVQTWQAAHGLTPDGVIGPRTWAAFIESVNLHRKPR